MNMSSWIRALGVVCVAALLTTGCGGGGDSAAGSQEAALAPIKEQWSALDAKRTEVADIAAQIAAAAEAGGEGEEGEAGEGEAGPSVEDLQAQLEAAQSEADGMSESFMNALITFLNSAGMVEGEAPPPAVLEAIHMKSSEDLLIANEYIQRGGDYRRAIDIVNTSLMLDPENADLQAALAKFEADQYMTEERFAQVSKGMTEGEVRDLLGTPNPTNVRDYPEQNVTAWFYRREDKGAAGVYFQAKDDVLKVYKLDFDAVKAEGEGEE